MLKGFLDLSTTRHHVFRWLIRWINHWFRARSPRSPPRCHCIFMNSPWIWGKGLQCIRYHYILPSNMASPYPTVHIQCCHVGGITECLIIGHLSSPPKWKQLSLQRSIQLLPCWRASIDTFLLTLFVHSSIMAARYFFIPSSLNP